MNQSIKWIIAAALAVVIIVGIFLIGGGYDIAGAVGGDSDEPITGEALEQASAAALEHVGEGQVTDTEVGDEEGYYEVEVTLGDGSQVDVHLDENFNVLGQEADEIDTNYSYNEI